MRFARWTFARLCGALLLVAVCWLAAAGGPMPARGQDVLGQDLLTAASGQVEVLISQLDDPDFATRGKAADRLARLAERQPLKIYLSRRFRRALLSSDTSVEVRTQLEPLVRALPAAGDLPTPGAAQIVPLLDQLSSDVYAQRDSAKRQLTAMLSHAELIAPLWLELKRRTADPRLPAADRRALEALCDAAREAWLRVGPEQVPLPKPSTEQIAGWIDDYSRLDEMEAKDQPRREQARRELLDLIVRDDTRDSVLELLGQRMAESDSEGGPLNELADFARPGMAAEVWLNHSLMTVQYLIVGLPQFNDTVTGRKATHFDRIDDETAHCVSGNSLTPGDYPVQVAIPHPQPGHETMFCLTNLPTPRRRLLYEYHLQRDERLRLQEMTDRTLSFYLKRGTPLDENEVLLLARLDPRSVSRFAGDYFNNVPNGPMLATLNGITAQPTVHGAMAAILSQIGTHEAVPALERLARSGALGERSYENRLDVAWVAALAIAGRDPWPGVDAWLAKLLDERLPLTADPDAPPDLGATAAGLLLDRHGASTRPFGLHTAGESLTNSFRFVGYRFSSDSDRRDVKRWWQKQESRVQAARAARLTETEPATVPALNPGAAQPRPPVR